MWRQIRHGIRFPLMKNCSSRLRISGLKTAFRRAQKRPSCSSGWGLSRSGKSKSLRLKERRRSESCVAQGRPELLERGGPLPPFGHVPHRGRLLALRVSVLLWLPTAGRMALWKEGIRIGNNLIDIHAPEVNTSSAFFIRKPCHFGRKRVQ